MISVHPYPASAMFRVAALALAIFIFGGGYSNAQSRATQGSASSQGPFFGRIGGKLVRVGDHRFVKRQARADQVPSFL